LSLLEALSPASVMTYTTAPIQVFAEESQFIETIEEKINQVALSHKIATTTLYNLAMSESSLGEKRVGDSGKSCGVIHFHKDYYPEENARCEDDEYILNRAAEMIAKGEEYKFTPCSCVQFVKAKGAKLPRGDADDLFPNTDVPSVGGVMILKYWKPERHHVAYIESIEKDGYHIIEANFKKCAITRRVIPINDKHIMGFWQVWEE